MNKEKILKRLEELKEEINSNKELKLESKNFRVNSDGWTKKTIDNIETLESPTKDIWEINEGKLKGEQLFTWEAAMRETKKAGKQMPTDEEFKNILRTKKDIENLLFAGHCYTNNCFNNQGTHMFLWTSSESGTHAWIRYLYLTNSTVFFSTYDKENGFSVRCLQD